VNYRGSTGYGREYRNRLLGRWGVADVEDCVAAARFLADSGAVDGERLIIRGSSAGGFTSLSALCSTDLFAAGASLYGVGELESLARDTHKFESRYLDGLIAPWPEGRETYAERSPLTHIESLTSPLIVFQGLLDTIVPPSQAHAIVQALRNKGIRYSYVEFADEAHGFRKAPNAIRCLEAELSFYAQVLGFPPPEGVAPVEVHNGS
jgi:dipeptidyl aminopeptidase/acylaminoacyl peptidase